MSNGDDDVIIIGTGHKRQAPDTTSPIVGELKTMKNRLADIKDWVIANGNDDDSREALNDAKHKVDNAIDRALALHAIVGD